MSKSKCKQSSQVPKNDVIAQTMPYFGCKLLFHSECKYPPDIAVVNLRVWADSHVVVDVHSQEQGDRLLRFASVQSVAIVANVLSMSAGC